MDQPLQRLSPNEVRGILLEDGYARFPVSTWPAVTSSVEQVAAHLSQHGWARFPDFDKDAR